METCTSKSIRMCLFAAMMHLVVVLVVLVSNVTGIVCPVNDFVDTLEVAFPEEGGFIYMLSYQRLINMKGMWVRKTEFIKTSAGVYNVSSITSKNEDHSLCVGERGQETCGLSIFDEFGLDFAHDGLVEINVSYCTTDLGCFCSAVRSVKCCLSVEEVEVHAEKKREDAIEVMRRWEDSELRQPEVSPWSCMRGRKWGGGAPRVIIGIKSAALHLPLRLAIRQSWLATLSKEAWASSRACAAFVIGIPDQRVFSATSALQRERMLHADMLLGEDGILVQDSYHTLPQKTAAFLRWALRLADDSLQYVLMVDDDVYVDLPGLLEWISWAEGGNSSEVGALKRFYAGEVYADLLHHKMKPQRHPAHRNHLPDSAFPFSELPRFAVGNAYILSEDLVRFVVRNLDVLQAVGDLEDVTLAVWFFSLQVYPRHLPAEVKSYSAIMELFGAEVMNADSHVTFCRPTYMSTADGSLKLPWAIYWVDIEPVNDFRTLSHMYGRFVDCGVDGGALPLSAARSEHAPRYVSEKIVIPETAYATTDTVSVVVYLPCLTISPVVRAQVELWTSLSTVVSALHVEFASDSATGEVELLNVLLTSGNALRSLPALPARIESVDDSDGRKVWRSYLQKFDVIVVADCFDVLIHDLLHRILDLSGSATDGNWEIGTNVEERMTTVGCDFTEVLQFPLAVLHRVMVTDKHPGDMSVESDQHVFTVRSGSRFVSPEGITSGNSGCFWQTLFRAQRLCHYETYLSRTDEQRAALPPLVLWGSRLEVWVSPGAAYAFSAVRDLLTRSFPSLSLVVFQMEAEERGQAGATGYRVAPLSSGGEPSAPAILVLSTLDGPGGFCRLQLQESGENVWPVECREHLSNMRRTISSSAAVVLLNGEAVDLRNATLYVSPLPDGTFQFPLVVLSAFTDARYAVRAELNTAVEMPPVMAYFPNAASSFVEMEDSAHSSVFGASMTPLDLLADRGDHWAAEALRNKSRSVAYLYFRCDRPIREAFFDVLTDRLGNGEVEALGRCAGERAGNAATLSAHYAHDRYSSNYLLSAIDKLYPFKFVIAFENSQWDGYVTEKLTNAYLARAVPIYHGAADVNGIFSSASMINCNDFKSLEECAARVAQVAADEKEYLSILAASPLVNRTAWCQFFQSHPIAADMCPFSLTQDIVGAIRHSLRQLT